MQISQTGLPCSVQPFVRVYKELRNKSANRQWPATRRQGGNIVGGCTFPYRTHLKMLRFLEKKFRKHSPKHKHKPENPRAHRTTGVDAERGRETEGEYRAREISELIRPMGLIGPSRQIPTT